MDNRIVFKIVFALGLCFTAAVAVYISLENKKQYFNEFTYKAQKEYHHFVNTYKDTASVLQSLYTFYQIDSQVTYVEFANLASRIQTYKSQENNHYIPPAQIGWIAKGPDNLLNILSGKNGTYTMAKVTENVALKPFELQKNLAGIDLQNLDKINLITDGVQLLARPVKAKLPDASSDHTLFQVDGYFYILINLRAYLNHYQKRLGSEFSIQPYLTINGPAPIKESETLIFSTVLDVLEKNYSLHIYHKSQWNYLNLIQNYSAFVVLGLGLIISFLFARHIRFVQAQNQSLKAQNKAVQEKADINENILENILDTLPVAVFGKNVQDNYKMCFFNKEAENLFQMSKEYMLGKSDFDLWPEEEAAWFHKIDQNVVRDGKLVNIPCEQVTRAGGETRLVHTRKVPIFDKNGTPVMLIGAALDITERINDEKELEQYRSNLEKIVAERTQQLKEAVEKSEEYSRMKSEFLATMSHEIRTPMNGILGMAELIQNAKPSDQVNSYARTIINSGETLQQIIDDILDFSKIEAGKLSIETMPVNMMDLVHDVARLYDMQARDKALEVVVRYKPGTEQFFYCDPVRMRQILSNMLANAIKFTSKGYIIITIESNENKTLPNDTTEMKFSITDTGPGLAPESQKAVFEKFTQGDASTTRNYGGTGLGLSICKSLVELMNGTIGVDSQEGKGSTFWFTVPLKQNTKEATIEPKPPILSGVRVLAVDDLPVVRKILKEQLNNAGMQCDVAENGEDALRKMQMAAEENNPYQIVIIDYLMPHMNGEMLASAINDHEILRKTCLIMLTSASNQMANEYFAKKGFSAYIAKPVSNHALIQSLAIVWGRYEQGETDRLIRVDIGAMGAKPEIHQHITLPHKNILVAEDNLVNQVFIQEVLEEMQVNHTLVCNGEQAVKAAQSSTFDLIIMDCLMPIMDGFDASRDIRNLEQSGRIKTHTPILALTANAMAGDREKCLAAGMDDYLSKPVRQQELKQKLYTMIMQDSPADHGQAAMTKDKHSDTDRRAKQPDPSNANAAGPDNIVILDQQAVENARRILKERYDEIVETYIQSTQDYINTMIQAMEKNDIEAIIRPAHTLKSTSKQMGAEKISLIAKDIEHKAKDLNNTQNSDQAAYQSITQQLDSIQLAFAETRKALDKKAA